MAKVGFPSGVDGDARAMALWARALYGIDKADQAFDAALQALEAARGDPAIHDLLASSLRMGAHGYHVPMLRDEVRNGCYRAALEAAIRPGMLVLEIGSGAGLLAMMAARAGAQVVTCEAQPMIAAAAQAIVERNGLADRISVISKPSDQLQVGVDLPDRADMLVSELFDNRLFGEAVVSILGEAKPRLLKPDALIIPPRAEIRCALAFTEFPDDRAPLGEVEGFDLTPFNLLAAPSSYWLNYSQRRVRLLSGVGSALAKDFTGDAPFGADETRVRLQSCGGEVNSVVQWIRFEFDDGSAYENDPFEDRDACWGRPMYMLPEPIHTQDGDEIDLVWRRIEDNVFVTAAKAPD